MKGIFWTSLCVSLLFLSLLRESEATQKRKDGVYIVYMGAATSTNGKSRDNHAQLLSSLMRRNRNALVHNYQNGFLGFAARLLKEEAQSIAQKPGVISVFPDPVQHLHTTRSWDFLKDQTDLEISSGSVSDTHSSSDGSDAIIGILDTGIWPEALSFNDKGIGPIPSRWNGTCMEGQNFTASQCNRKLIGARYYEDGSDSKTKAQGTPRDKNGHGTHVASTAAGIPVPGASYYGLASGTAKGGSIGARIAMYQVCALNGCSGAAIMKAFDDAIGDRVDVLSLSLGSSGGSEPDYFNDPIAIGAFHAVERGITVVCSAGNDGPDPGTVVNVAPWILNVAATTIDRNFEANVALGGDRVIQGTGINFGNIQKSPVYPLIYGGSAKSSSGDVTYESARNCNPGSLDDGKVKGKIIICENTDEDYSPKTKLAGVKSQGAVGFVLIDDSSKYIAPNFGDFPASVVTEKDASDILSYINSTRNPVGTILPTVSVTKTKPAPVVAFFSSRGPSLKTRNILKPDIAGPGVNILAAWPINDKRIALPGRDPPLFFLESGTSMSCPHVSGIAAAVKSQNPTWSPSAIRSAIMTSASQLNNLKAPITTETGSVATPFDYGAGEVSTTGPLQPGLVYETETVDYLLMLCYSGYNLSTIRRLTSIPDGFSCPEDSKADLISNINYPSIAITNFSGHKTKNITRTVTNVDDDDDTVYIATVDAPNGLHVDVTPSKLHFTKDHKKLSFQVIFTSSSSSTARDLFGSVTWSNGKYKVRSPFAVSLS